MIKNNKAIERAVIMGVLCFYMGIVRRDFMSK